MGRTGLPIFDEDVLLGIRLGDVVELCGGEGTGKSELILRVGKRRRCRQAGPRGVWS